jgi:hypothetical protein
MERKEPRFIKQVYKEINEHPKFNNLSEGTKIGLMVGEKGYSWCTRQDNQWARQIWRFLYNGIECKDINKLFQ